jgi:hypothetical protein
MEVQMSGEIYIPNGEYYPTEIIGSCSNCRAVGRVVIPMDSAFLKRGDTLMDRKPIEVECEWCGVKAEFVPSDPKGVKSHSGHRLLQKTEIGKMKHRGVIK